MGFPELITLVGQVLARDETGGKGRFSLGMTQKQRIDCQKQRIGIFSSSSKNALQNERFVVNYSLFYTF
jgi:hypothetical protein